MSVKSEWTFDMHVIQMRYRLVDYPLIWCTVLHYRLSTFQDCCIGLLPTLCPIA